MPDAGAAGIATATAGFTTGGLKTFCGWSLGRSEAGLKGVAARGFDFGFCVDVFGEAEAAGLVEEEDSLEG